MNQYDTEELPSPQDINEHTFLPPLEPPPPGMIRYIDIHVYDEPAEEEEENDPAESEYTVEGHPTIVLPQEDQDEQEPAIPPRQRQYTTLVPLFLAGVSLLIIVTILVVILVLPLFAPSATVTILPVSHEVSTTTTIPLSIGASGTPGHLTGRMLPSVTMSTSETIHTSGTAHQEAHRAHGLVTFYNAAPYAQTVFAETLLTGADGTEIVTDQDAVIPAGNLATNGQATVSAHTFTSGPTGNIAAGDVYGPCCRANVLVSNAAFTGGTTARDYRTVSSGDITGAAAMMTASLQQSVQAALHTQVQPTETLLTPLSCTHTVTSDHAAGTKATSDHVTVTETCTGMVYPTQAYQRLTSALLAQAAHHQLGTSYTLTGPSQSTITQVTTTHGTLLLHVHVSDTAVYQFSDTEQAQIKATIAGKSKEAATAVLLAYPGVQMVSVMTSSGDTLPGDPGRITLEMLVMP